MHVVGRPRDESREKAILDAAIGLVAEVGYDGMSVEAIAGRAGASKATIYRRWPGKAQLVADAIRRLQPEAAPEPEDTGSLRGDLLALTRFMFESMGGLDGGLLCGLAVAVRSDPELGRLLDTIKRDARDRAQSLIVSRAKAREEMERTADPPDLIDVAAALSLFHVLGGKPLDEDFAIYLVDKVLLPLTR
jgi:AcrR family transcriptional regulator